MVADMAGSAAEEVSQLKDVVLHTVCYMYVAVGWCENG